MISKRLWTAAALMPALALVVAGCGGGGDVTKKTASTSSSTEITKKDPPPAGGATGIEGSGATVKGKITYDGTPPAPKDLDVSKSNDKDHCLKGDIKDPLWKVGADKGVANVVVWLRAPAGKYFKVPPGKQARKDEVVIDQPFCAFEPHVTAIFPYFYDAETKKLKKTGQVFKVVNDAPINHNTSYSATNTIVNPGKNEILKSKAAMPIDVKPGSDTKAGGEELLSISCTIHGWMTAKTLVFDHPYFAVTGPDGSFEIKDAPADADVELAYWHESFGNRPKDAKTKTLKLKSGTTEENFSIK